jgi:hypothetical protein
VDELDWLDAQSGLVEDVDEENFLGGGNFRTICAIMRGIHDVPARLDAVLYRDLTLRPSEISVTLPSICPRLLAPC